MEKIKFICPNCNKEWFEEQNPNDEWYNLAVTLTLCDECRKKYLEEIKHTWRINEIDRQV